MEERECSAEGTMADRIKQKIMERWRERERLRENE